MKVEAREVAEHFIKPIFSLGYEMGKKGKPLEESLGVILQAVNEKKSLIEVMEALR